MSATPGTPYVAGEFNVDELFEWGDLGVSAHVYGKWDADERLYWINVRLLEIATENPRMYRGEEFGNMARPDSMTSDARSAADLLGAGHITYSGCAEWKIDHHCCSVSMFVKMMTAILRVYRWAHEQGMEECDPENAIVEVGAANGP